MGLSIEWNNLVQGAKRMFNAATDNTDKLEQDHENAYDQVIASHHALNAAHKNELIQVLNSKGSLPLLDGKRPHHVTEEIHNLHAKQYAETCERLGVPNEYEKLKKKEIRENGFIDMDEPRKHILNNPELTEPRLRELHEENPDDIGVAQWLALNLQIQGKLEESFDISGPLLYQNPTNKTCYNRYCTTLEDAKRKGDLDLVEEERLFFIESRADIPKLNTFFEKILEEKNTPDLTI